MSFNIEDYLNSLPLDITEIDVSRRGLTYLPDLSRFKQLTKLDCSENQLSELPHLNDNLIYLYCSSNQLTELPPLNDNLIYLICYYNQLTELPHLNNKLQFLDCSDNNIKNINNIIKILRNFRYTYYLLKFKKHFKRWLWEKVREPKIMAKFHPSHLDALEETDDLEVFLEDWINK